MKQVIQSARTGKLGLRDVPDPVARPGHLLVETEASLISAGTERMVVDFARKSLAAKAKARPDLVRKVMDKAKRDGFAATFRAVMARLDEPLPLGYSAAGHVVGVGAGLEGRFRTGDRVAVAGAGLANHAELNLVPEALAAPVPFGVPMEQAAFGTVGAIALHAVRNLEPKLGDVVGVIGVGLLGQMACSLLSLSGARPIALDLNPDRLELAKTMGAEEALSIADGTAPAAIQALTKGLGCDSVLVAAATSSNEPLQLAAEIARDRARVCLLGLTGTEISYRDFMAKELNLVVSRSYGPGRYDPAFENRGVLYPPGWVRWTETENLCEVVRLMDEGLPRRLDVTPLITHRFALAKAEDAYQLVTGGGEPHLGVVLNYPKNEAGAEVRAKKVSFETSTEMPARSACVLGCLGAGAFARTVLLPRLKGMAGVELDTIVTTKGATADHGQDAYGFRQAACDEAAILDDARINAVLIATRHDSHADLTAKALTAGKSVLVEKPLALSRDQLNAVIEARQAREDVFFQVGFNRRFSEHTTKLKAFIAEAKAPHTLVIRVNGGAIPADSWIQGGEGGGRMLGEACHFVDLARALVGSPIISVGADSAAVIDGAADDVTALLRFADGSLATLAYTALGDTAYAKERVEVFSGGRVAVLDDFRKLTATRDGKTTTLLSGNQDKGFDAQLAAFVGAVKSGGPAPIPEDELVETSLATLAILESLQTGTKINLA
ncbi:MAG: bi-domain-containing oxidoreductase [Magnetovibrionaceae bacterium]